MKLSQRQFDMLVFIERFQAEQLTQRKLAQNLDVSLGLVNKILSELIDLNAIELISLGKYQVSKVGYELLAPYRVKRAILLAAGFGERLMPVTKTKAKSLIEINGVRLIDRMLDALVDAEIDEIIIVRGYLKEQFDELVDKYPMIRFVDNERYATSKNISSAYLVRDLLANSYIIEADIILMNPNLIQKYEFATHYKSVRVERSDVWCFETVGQKIKHYGLGGENVDEMLGISYWTATDAKKLESDLDWAFHAPAGMERFWDDVALILKKEHYSIEVKRYDQEDAVELRSIEQLNDLNT